MAMAAAGTMAGRKRCSARAVAWRGERGMEKEHTQRIGSAAWDRLARTKSSPSNTCPETYFRLAMGDFSKPHARKIWACHLSPCQGRPGPCTFTLEPPLYASNFKRSRSVARPCVPRVMSHADPQCHTVYSVAMPWHPCHAHDVGPTTSSPSRPFSLNPL